MNFGAKRQPNLGQEAGPSSPLRVLSSAIVFVPLVVLGCTASPKLASHAASTMPTADPDQTSRQTELASAPAVQAPPKPSAALQAADAAPEPTGAPPASPAADIAAQPQPATPPSSAVPPDDSEPLASDGPPKFNPYDFDAGDRFYGAVRVGWSATRLRIYAGGPRAGEGQIWHYFAGRVDGPGVDFWFTIKGGVVTAIRRSSFACKFRF
jgi:hypothetical protein